MDFKDRLKQASERAGVPYSATAIARALGIRRRQTVHRWLCDGAPNREMIAHIAECWKVDPSWLATGDGEMIPTPDGLSREEREIIGAYRSAQPQRRRVLYTMVKALGKAMLVAALVVPPMLPAPAEAAFNIIFNGRHIVRRWLRALFARRLETVT